MRSVVLRPTVKLFSVVLGPLSFVAPVAGGVSQDRRPRQLIPFTTSDVVRVGNQSRLRTDGACLDMAVPGADLNPDPVSGAAEILAGKGTLDSSAGGRVQVYAYTLTYPAPGATPGRIVHFKVFVASDTGLLKRMQQLDDRGAVTFTWDYFDYDARMTIELPACS